jgi:hypothetical protein
MLKLVFILSLAALAAAIAAGFADGHHLLSAAWGQVANGFTWG